MDSGDGQKKPPNPRENASYLSAATFFFTLPLFYQGWKKELEITNIYETLNEDKSSLLGDKLETSWNAEQEKAKKCNRKPNLRRAIVRTFGPRYLLYGCALAFVEISVKLIQPLCLGRLISYYSLNQETIISEHDAYLYATGIICCSIVNVLIFNPCLLGSLHMGMKIRVACCSLIYRKALKLNKTALGQTTAGHIVNLLSNDVSRFDFVMPFLNYMWIGPLQTMIALILMYQEVGISAVIGVVFLLLFIPLQMFLGKLSSIYRLKAALKTDERIRLMNEIISGIQVIKMYTWEKPFEKLISLSRRNEIKSVRVTSYLRGVFTSFTLFATRTALFVTIIGFILFGHSIDAQKVFMLTAVYNVLRQSMTVFYAQGLTFLAETNVSIKRLNKFLLYEETDVEELSKTQKTVIVANDIEGKTQDNVLNAVSLQNGTANWTKSSKDSTLTNLNINIKRGSLVAVIGPVGCGKTSLLQAILKELPLDTGTLNVYGSVSYASQESWLFTGSVRQNILFGQEMERARYKTVIKNCALERDFKFLPYADKTIIGERGVTLSGGQRARINLARAVYKEADIYLFDDPLSAVDTHVGNQLFQNCIREYLHEKTVVLITHQLQYLKDVDRIIILENGILKAEGTFTELQNSGLELGKFLKIESEEDREKLLFSKRISLCRETSTTSRSSIEGKPVPQEVKEQMGSGSLPAFVFKSYIKAAGNWCTIFILLLLLIVTQVLVSLSDYFISYWVNLEQRTEAPEGYQITSADFVVSNSKNMTGPRNMYETNADSSSFWNFSTETSIYVYSGLTVAIIIFSLIRSFTFFTMCMQASVRLHDIMFTSIIHATMKFFNTNTSGRILNRFSKDMGVVDERVPLNMVDGFQTALSLLGILIVVVSTNPWLLFPTVVISILFYILRVFYLRTSRTVKRLEGVTRSPVFTHLSESLQGLTTIRAFGAQAVLEKEFDNHQDLHSSVWFLFLSSSVGFGYFLDIICVIYVAIVTMSFLVIGNVQYGGTVGLAITQSITLTGILQWCMRQTAELEVNMTSVERVLEYTIVEREPSLKSSSDKEPVKTWPEKGEIKFVNLFLYYFLENPPVLKNLNFIIRPLEKIGIVGRTGAGKSSLIAALFRLTDLEGSIIIDQIDTKDIGIHDLRSKISIIPQEPVLFSGTLRKNLDPFDEYEDEVLWKALEQVELKEVVGDIALGLNSKMSEGGKNFSVGQRQLVCLARAIIRNNKILVLDEATANVDPHTDSLIQQTIRKKFADCTVLTIAHRLQTVMDSDKVLVMDAGIMVEFDHPHLLLQNQNGRFYGMVEQTGKVMAEALAKTAEDSYKQLQVK